MSAHDSIEIIFKVAKSKLKEGEASTYVGEVVTFCINRLSEHGKFSSKQLEAALKEEAEFHLKCQGQDVA